MIKIILLGFITILILILTLKPIENLDNIPAKIPKIVLQTYKDKSLISPKVYENIKKYGEGYEHIVYDDNDCLEFIKKHNNILCNKNLIDVWNSLKNGAHKADLFRYCVLYVKGGIYLDIKTKLIQPLEEIFIRDNILYTVIGACDGPHTKCIFQGVIASPPRNRIFLELIDFVANSTNVKGYSKFVKDFYKKVSRKTGKRILKNGFYKNNEGDIDFYLFQEKCEDKNVCEKLNEDLDLYGLCCHIYDKGNIIINTRMSEWKGGETGWNSKSVNEIN